MNIRKRDGQTLQPFNISKIQSAIRGAWVEVHGTSNEETIRTITDGLNLSTHGDVVDVEMIQDAVEVALMRAHEFAVAKAYIVFRDKRSAERREQLHPDPVAVSDYIHASKYARHVSELGRRELYDETVARVEMMHQNRFKHIPELRPMISEAFDLVRAKRLLPSMRAMQFGGAAIESTHNRLYNCSASLVDRPRVFAEAMFLLLCGCGVGYSVQFDHVEQLSPLAYVDQKKVVHHIIGDSIEGWADAVDALVNSYYDGTLVEFAFHDIRGAGAPLKTSGGRAPGHLKLKLALERVRSVLHGAQGRQLRPIECHKIMCHIADAVLSGGIRRSAMIALFSLDDGEMMNCKADASWFANEPWFANANNSVVMKRDEVTRKQFDRIFQKTRHYGEPGIFFVEDYDHVTNPCQPGWATVLTPGGVRTFDDIGIGSVIWSGKQWTKVTNKVMTGTKPVSAYHTRAGVFVGTENHRIISNGERVEVKDAETVDIAVGGAEGGVPFAPKAVMDGLVIGDGTVHHASNDAVWLCIGEKDRDYHTSDVSGLIGRRRTAAQAYAWEISTSIAWTELPLTYLRQVPKRYRFGTELMVRSFLRGLYSANGSVVGDCRVTLKAASFQIILQVQEMLSSLGINSYYTTNKPATIKFSNGDYTCRESYDLNITSGRVEFARLIGFIQKDKTERLLSACARTSRGPRKLSYEIVSVEPLGEHPVYDITVEAEEHTYWTGGLLVSNCAEILLQPKLSAKTGWAMCNLTEINAAKLTSFEDFVEVAKAATLIGTLQASYTDMPYLGEVTEKIVRRDALLGIGMTGMQDQPAIACDPDNQKKIAGMVKKWNSEFATLIGINKAARTTCVKPSGTTSLELGSVASGIHPHHAKRYIRRVTADELEVVFQAFKAKNPKLCTRKPDGKWVIEFPVEAPEGAALREHFNAIEFLDVVRSTQLNWVVPGTARGTAHHNVSNTITVREDEWKAVANYLWKNREDFAGVSLLSDLGDQVYAFAPFESVKTSDQMKRWNELIASYTPVDYSALTELEDVTNLSGELACAGGSCLI